MIFYSILYINCIRVLHIYAVDQLYTTATSIEMKTSKLSFSCYLCQKPGKILIIEIKYHIHECYTLRFV